MTNDFTSGAEGVFFTLEDSLYRKAAGVSNSMLKHISLTGDDVGSPAHFQANLQRQSEDTKALFFGRMVHSKILTPDEPLPSVIVPPAKYPAPADCTAVKTKKCQPGDLLDWHGAAKYCQQWVADREAEGITVVSESELRDIEGVVNAVAKNPIAMMSLKTGNSEVSLFKNYWCTQVGTPPRKPILRKARIDWVPAGPALVDIKTTLDARKDEFSKSLYKYRYYVQAAYYLDLWNDLNPANKKTNFVFIAVEKKAPFAVNVFNVTDRALEAGRQEYMRNLHVLMTCIETDHWPAYGDDVKQLDLPAYAYKNGLEIYG